MIAGSSRRVVVFLDYQNVYHRAREAFCARDAPAREGQVDPLALGRLLASRVSGGSLTSVRAYRGRPSRRLDPRSYAAFRRQTWAQAERGAGLVTVIARDLRYPPDWPTRRAQEKAIDVALAVDFVMMAARRECDVGILLLRAHAMSALPRARRRLREVRPGEILAVTCDSCGEPEPMGAPCGARRAPAPAPPRRRRRPAGRPG